MEKNPAQAELGWGTRTRFSGWHKGKYGDSDPFRVRMTTVEGQNDDRGLSFGDGEPFGIEPGT
jgi:hypothetical protein